ncbi:MAG: V-type ATPase subunit, partial [Gemmatimonadota bacterium]
LRDGPYGRDVGPAAGTAPEAALIDEGLRRNVAAAFAKLHAISAGECRRAAEILLGFADVQAVKTVLRGKNARLSAAEIAPALVPAGAHGEAALEEMCRQPDVRAVVDLLATWRDPFARPLRKALADYREPKDLFLLEAALDGFWHGEARRRLAGIRGEAPGVGAPGPLTLFLAFAADRTNLVTALTAVEEGIVLADRRRYFLPGGRVFGPGDFDALLSCRTVAEALEMADRSAFAGAFRNLPAPSGGVPLLSIVERRVERVFLRAVRAAMRADPLSLAAPLAYLVNKGREVANIRTIVRARASDLPEPDVMALLILDD